MCKEREPTPCHPVEEYIPTTSQYEELYAKLSKARSDVYEARMELARLATAMQYDAAHREWRVSDMDLAYRRLSHLFSERKDVTDVTPESVR